jgi:glycosyltransferase involved in cell wall biosynthesis
VNEPIRVAMVAACPFPVPRGSPIRIQRMAEAISELGMDVHVVTYHLGRPLEGAAYLVHRIPRIPTYRFEEPGPTYQKLLVVDPLLAFALRRVLARQRVDVIHAHHYEGLLVALAARGRRRTPIVYDAHTLLESELPAYSLGLGRSLKNRLGIYLDRHLPPLADHVIAVSERIQSKLEEEAGIGPERISVITSGVEWRRFQGSRQPRRDAEPVIVYAGGMAPYQGIDLMLRAFREVLLQRPDARLWIVTQSRFDAYQPLAKSLGILAAIRTLQADFERLPELLARADVALNPRIDCDGVPHKLLNYMAAGLPIVSFAGSAKTLQHGETGWIVEDGNIPAFARATLHLLSDPELAARLGRTAREKGEAAYTWEIAARRVRSVYQRVLGRGQGGVREAG